MDGMRRALALLCLACGSAYAQDDVTVAGRVLDSTTGQPVPFATITMLREGRAVGGELADEVGRFVIEGLGRGSYTVHVGFVGYTAAETPLLVGERNDNYDLGDLALVRAEGVTDEVIVTAQRQVLEANLDRRVFNVGEDLARATGSVLDAMRGLPGVTVSQEGQIQLRGSDRVAILIDGKQSGLTGIGNQAALDSIPAGSIESIEVINNPSAAYDAAGMAGVINIVYRQDQTEGLQIDGGLALGVGALDKRRPDLPTDLGSFSSNEKINPRVNLVNIDRRHLVDHRVPDRAGELQPVEVDGPVCVELAEIGRSAVVLVDEHRLAVDDDERGVAAGPVGDRRLDMDRHAQPRRDLDLLGVDGADEVGEPEFLEGPLLLEGRIAGEQDRDVAAQVIAQPRLVVVVAVQVRDVQEVGVLDALLEIVGQSVVAREREPRTEERGHEPRIAEDRPGVGLDQDSRVADRRRAHPLRLRSGSWPPTA
jgi:hypothetical protein